jgi:hypothetical protein
MAVCSVSKYVLGGLFASTIIGCGGAGARVGDVNPQLATLNNKIAAGNLSAIVAELQKGTTLALPTTTGSVDDVMAQPVGEASGRVRVDGTLNGGAIYFAWNLGEKNADGTGAATPTQIAIFVENKQVKIVDGTENGNSGTCSFIWNGRRDSVHGRALTTVEKVNTATASIATYFGIPNTTLMSSRAYRDVRFSPAPGQ